MSRVAREIIQKRKLDELYAIAATVPWELSGNYMLATKVSIYQASALDELGLRKGHNFSLAKPDSFDAVKTPLWKLLLPAAEKRFAEFIERLTALPWRYTNPDHEWNYPDFIIRIDRANLPAAGLMPDQVRELEQLARDKEIKVEYSPKEVVYSITKNRGHVTTFPRLYFDIFRIVVGQIEKDAKAISILPWESINGGLVVEADVFERMKKARLGESVNDAVNGVELEHLEPLPQDHSLPGIFAKWNIKLTNDGKYFILLAPQHKVAQLPNRPSHPTIMQTADRSGFLVVIPGMEPQQLNLSGPFSNKISADSRDDENKADGAYKEYDFATYHMFEIVSDAISARNKHAMVNEFVYDQAIGFYISPEVEVPANSINSSTALIVSEDGRWVISDITAHGQQWHDGEELRKKLAEAIPHDFNIGDLGKLDWQYSFDGRELHIGINELALSAFAKGAKVTQTDTHFTLHFFDGRKPLSLLIDAEKQQIYEQGALHGYKFQETPEGLMVDLNIGTGYHLHTTHPDQLTLKKHVFEHFPYYVAIGRKIREKGQEFVLANLDQVTALPWWFKLQDQIKSADPGIFKSDLKPEQRGIYERLIQLNLLRGVSYFLELRDMWGSWGHEPELNTLYEQLNPVFVAWIPEMIADIANLPWQREDDAFWIEKDKLSKIQERFISRVYAGMGVFSRVDSEVCTLNSKESDDYEPAAINKLRSAIGVNLSKTAPKPLMQEDILQLPWHFAGKAGEWDIVLEMDQPSPAQLDVLDALPDIFITSNDSDSDMTGLATRFYNDCRKSTGWAAERIGIYSVHIYGPKSHNVVAAIFQAHYYEQLLPVAERNFSRLIQEVGTFPWRLNTDGKHQLDVSEISKEQQKKMMHIPGELLDLKSMVDRMDSHKPYVKTHRTNIYVVNPAADNVLAAALRNAKTRSLPEFA